MLHALTPYSCDGAQPVYAILFTIIMEGLWKISWISPPIFSYIVNGTYGVYTKISDIVWQIATPTALSFPFFFIKN